MKTIKTIKQLLWASLPALLLLLSACSTEFDSTPEVASETYKTVSFSLPHGGFKVLVNGDTLSGHGTNLKADVTALDVDILFNGKVIFSEKAMPIPQDRTYRFNFNMVEVLGHGTIDLAEEKLHKLTITVQEPTDKISIKVKGLGQDVKIEPGKTYNLAQSDVEKGNISIDIAKGQETLWSKDIPQEEKKTDVALVWNSDQSDLVSLAPPSDEQREQLVEVYDTFLSFMYSSADFPDVKSMILELAPSHYFENPYFPDAFKEGYEPVKIEISPDQPTDFVLFNNFEEGGILFIYKLYDSENPDAPLLTGDDYGYVLYCQGLEAYNGQGEDNFKFRCYQFMPTGSPNMPEDAPAYFSPFPVYQRLYSFK